jgi:chemotaxis protein MotB
MAKHKHEEHENHERWLVSYADFITLLFAFFVVMYSVSAVNEGKFRTVSESIKAALNPIVSPPSSRLAFNIGEQKPKLITPDLASPSEPVVRKIRQVLKSLDGVADLKLISVAERANGDILVTIPDHLLFLSGEARLRPEGFPFLRAFSEVLTQLDRHVNVLGHTDNVPIRTPQFPSNWELSAARAVTVVRVMTELYGVPAEHLSATGMADSRPIVDNLTPEHRARNRRVEILVLEANPDTRRLDQAAGPVSGPHPHSSPGTNLPPSPSAS